MLRQVNWGHPGREQVDLTLDLDGEQIVSVTLQCIGPLPFLKMGQEIKKTLTGNLSQVPLPSGRQSEALIWREVLLKAKDEWRPPFDEGELCHCRKITSEQVAQALIYGAHDVDELRRRTSANTGCGTCLPEMKALRDYYLGDS